MDVDVGFFEASAQIIPVLMLALAAISAFVRRPLEEFDDLHTSAARLHLNIERSEEMLAALPEDIEDERVATATESLKEQRSGIESLYRSLHTAERPVRNVVRLTTVVLVLVFVALSAGLGICLTVLAQPELASNVLAVWVFGILAAGISGVMLEFSGRLMFRFPHGWDYLVNWLLVLIGGVPAVAFLVVLLVLT